MEIEKLWLEEARKKLKALGTTCKVDECNEMLRTAVLEKVDQILKAINSVSTTLASRASEDLSQQDCAAVTIETGK